MKAPEIVFRDPELVVLNKPAGWVVNEAESVQNQPTIMKWVRENLLEPAECVGLMRERWGVCHRLDKETTGCLVVALKEAVLKEMMALFAGRKVKKEYLALVHGLMTPTEGTVRLPISRSGFDRQKFQVHFDGKHAQTQWRVERVFPEARLSLVRLFPLTGRTHQIRVHLSHLGYPIVSDSKYLNKGIFLDDRKQIEHHVLHAARIGFEYSGGKVDVESPLPDDVQRLLSCL